MESILLQFNLWWAGVAEFFYFDPQRLHEPEMIVRLAVQAVLLVGSAFYSSSETALFSLSRLDLQNLRKSRHRRSETIHALLDQPRRLIISILCGNELVNIAASANMAGILVFLYGSDEQAAWINILVMVPLLLLLGEVTPKTIAVSIPVRYSAFVSAPLSLWVRIVSPLRWLIRGVADRVTTMIVGHEKAADNILQVDEFRSLVEDVAEEGILDATERVLIYNLLEAGDTEIVEIMTPRTRVHFLNVDTPVSEMVAQFRKYQHPRVPVFRNHHDEVVGFVHAEDIVRLVLDNANLEGFTPDDILHPPVMVPLTKRVDEMFEFFQHHNARAAIVLNEFGGVEGFVTMKDVLTFIFGEISGEVQGEELYREKDENRYVVPGDMKLADFNNLTNFGIEDPRMTTIGGVAFRHLDSMPRVGDKVTVEDVSIKILEMDGHRIAKVRVKKGAVAPQELAAGAEEGETEASRSSQGPEKPKRKKKLAKARQQAEAADSPPAPPAASDRPGDAEHQDQSPQAAQPAGEPQQEEPKQ
jgi:putative hemolysin